MSASNPRNMLVRIKQENNGFLTVAGLRTKEIKLATNPVDSTTMTRPAGWRELLAGAGTKTADILGEGVMSGSASDGLLRTLFLTAAINNFEIVLPEIGTISGPFMVNFLRYKGEIRGEALFDLGLASAGPVTITPL